MRDYKLIYSVYCNNRSKAERNAHKLAGKISERKGEWFNIKNECPCGGKYTNVHKSQHFKTKKHKRYIGDN